MYLIDYFTDHYKPRRLLGKSPHTTRLYKASIKAFGQTLGKKPTLDDLTDENLILHLQRRIDDGLSVATANKDRSQLLAIWRQAFRQKMIDTLPDVPEMPEPQRTPVAWLPQEVEKLFGAIYKSDGEIGGVPSRLWWDGLIRLSFDTGERIGALRAARWDWINDEWINFPAEVRKGRKRDRSYKMSQATRGSLNRLRPHTGGVECFPFPYSETYIWKLYKRLLERAGLPSNRKCLFHRNRRTVASVVYASGHDAQDALDHTHKRTTQQYLDPRYKRDISVCDILAAYLANPRHDDRQQGAG